MEQIELVIKIPKEDYALLMSGRFYLCGSRGNGKTITSNLMESICNGTILPKGHGRLVDADKVYAKAMFYVPRDYDGILMEVKDLKNAPTIIEADNAGDARINEIKETR